MTRGGISDLKPFGEFVGGIGGALTGLGMLGSSTTAPAAATRTGLNVSCRASQFGSALGGVGLFAAGGGSSRKFKENIKAVKNLDAILDQIDETPVYLWNYKAQFGSTKTMIGPVTEEAPDLIVGENGMTVVPVSYLGFLFGAVKALNAKVKAVEGEAASGASHAVR